MVEGGVPPPPPPAPAQLARPKELRMKIARRNVPRRRRRIAKGKRMRLTPRARSRDANSPGARLEFSAEVEARPVATCTATLPVAFADTVSFGGLKVHEEFAGSELQLKVKVPLEPPSVVRLRVKLAV